MVLAKGHRLIGSGGDGRGGGDDKAQGYHRSVGEIFPGTWEFLWTGKGSVVMQSGFACGGLIIELR